MQQITVNEESYNRMVIALAMVALAAQNAKDGNVSAEAIGLALDFADFPTK